MFNQNVFLTKVCFSGLLSYNDYKLYTYLYVHGILSEFFPHI